MAETLGSLCDKLTIVELKKWHTEDAQRLKSLEGQSTRLQGEINGFLVDAVRGDIPAEMLTFAANKVYRKQGNELSEVVGKIGAVFAELAKVNCELWHEQEKVYDFESVAAEQKNAVVKALAHLNLRRNQCIDAIDRNLNELITESAKPEGSHGNEAS
jgi:hypothetical protein